MAVSYRMQKGKLVLLAGSGVKKHQFRNFFHRFMQFGWGVLSLLTTCVLTYMIYLRCVFPVAAADGSMVYSLSDCITTGALFATFGSAVIGVFSLSATSCLNLFYENLAIWEEDLSFPPQDETKWKRWSFLPRLSKMSVGGKTRYLGVSNASVCFTTTQGPVCFLLPTTQADFWELPAFRSFLRMKCHRNDYLNYLNGEDAIEEYPAWDCLCAIYKSILAYRFSFCCVWIGACFVLESILFSFFYPCLCGLVMSYFQVCL